MIHKIYIVGPVGSGKSTLARKLAAEYGFFYCELDSIVYESDPHTGDNRKRPAEKRDFLFQAALSNERWIVEDAGRAYFEAAMQGADSIIHLEPPVYVRLCRIILRWLKQKLHMEKCGYIPDLPMLRFMFKWTRNYESGSDGVKERIAKYKDKTFLIKTEQEIERYIQTYLTEPPLSHPIKHNAPSILHCVK